MGVSEFEDSYDDDPAEKEREREEQQFGAVVLNAPIRALEPPPAVSVADTTSIRDAMQVMLDNRIGAVLVMKDGAVAGIFTERDVLSRVVLSGVDLTAPIRDVMTPSPETLSLDDGIVFALNRMIIRGFRHIPVLDEKKQPAAVLSVRSVVAFIVRTLPRRVLNLPPEPELGIPRGTDGG